MYNIKSILGRICNYVGRSALHCEIVVSSYVCQPNHSYADFYVSFTQLLCPCVEYSTVLFMGLWPHSFHNCTAFIWYLLCAVTPPSHCISVIIHEFCTLPNTLLTTYIHYAMWQMLVNWDEPKRAPQLSLVYEKIGAPMYVCSDMSFICSSRTCNVCVHILQLSARNK